MGSQAQGSDWYQSDWLVGESDTWAPKYRSEAKYTQPRSLHGAGSDDTPWGLCQSRSGPDMVFSGAYGTGSHGFKIQLHTPCALSAWQAQLRPDLGPCLGLSWLCATHSSRVLSQGRKTLRFPKGWQRQPTLPNLSILLTLFGSAKKEVIEGSTCLSPHLHANQPSQPVSRRLFTLRGRSLSL